jgi:hypothetical protein
LNRGILIVLLAISLLVALRLSGVLPRQTGLGKFVLLYVYEANTHTQAGSGEGPGAPPAPGTYGDGAREQVMVLDNDRLYVARGALPWAATQVCVIRETSFAGVTAAQRLLQTARSSLTGHVGQSAGPGLFDHTYRIAVVTPGGAVKIEIGGTSKVLSPGESWNVIARRQDGQVILIEEMAENAALLEELARLDEQASRVSFCNYGVWDTSWVGRPRGR